MKNMNSLSKLVRDPVRSTGSCVLGFAINTVEMISYIYGIHNTCQSSNTE